MAISQLRSRRKASGGRYIDFRKKKLRELGNLPRLTKLGEQKKVSLRVRAGNKKTVLLRQNIANVFDPKSKKYDKLKILTIVDNPANRHFIRRNIITRGAIIKTEKGNAKVLNRPGQEGMINAVLV